MLPQHGPGPSGEAEAKMEKAGSLLYRAYSLMETASHTVEEAQEQVRTHTRAGTAAANLASGEALVKRGHEAFAQGDRLRQEAEAALQAAADPLGPPPEAPKAWANVDGMAQRAGSRERAVRGAIAELRHDAKRAGVSLVAMASSTALAPAAAVAAEEEDPVEKQQDDKILAFLSKY
mmetsp:Transcript_122653/g.318957  ORF Transcript_122653/g.318957 Transcript_122653/m.318957 type:complete len:177 (+) Transcript_122653:883-1413(+)